jgi:hypothetical protein
MGGLTPSAAKIALPESVASPSEFRFGINVESPSSGGEGKDRSQAQSRASRRSTGAKDDERATATKGDVPTVSALSSHKYIIMTYFPFCTYRSRLKRAQGREVK